MPHASHAVFLLLSAVVLLPASGCATISPQAGGDSAHAHHAAEALQPPTAAQRTHHRLQQPIPVNFEGTPLKEAFEHIRQAANVPLLVKWRAMQGVGLDPGTPVTLTLGEIPAEHAIAYVIDHVSGQLVDVDYLVDESGVVIVAPIAALGSAHRIRVYDIRDMLVLIGALRTEAAAGDSQDEDIYIHPAELTLQIKDLIRLSVDPDNWREAGGLISSMNEVDGTLVINTTRPNHEAIVALLAQLRAARMAPYHVEARVLLVKPSLYRDHIEKQLRPAEHSRGHFRARELMGMDMLDPAEVDALLQHIHEDAQNVQLASFHMAALNGQQAEVAAGRDTSYLIDYARDASSGKLEPHYSTTWEGVRMKMRGLIAPNREAITMLVDVTLADFVSGEPVADRDSPPHQPLMVTSPRGRVVQLHTTASIPQSMTLLMAGTTMAGNPLDANSADERERHIIILITPTAPTAAAPL